MTLAPPDQPHLRFATPRPITAITYGDGVVSAMVLRRLATLLARNHVRCSGFVQMDEPRDDRARCDMVLVDLTSHQRLKISEDRGPMARGCLLDASELVRAVEQTRRQLDLGAEVLIINKFGKTEAEGGGFRSLIGDGIERGIPILIAVPWRNIESWRAFAGDLACEISAETLAMCDDASLPRLVGLSMTDNAMPAARAESAAPARP